MPQSMKSSLVVNILLMSKKCRDFFWRGSYSEVTKPFPILPLEVVMFFFAKLKISLAFIEINNYSNRLRLTKTQ